MTEEEFNTVGFGNVIYRNDQGRVRLIVGVQRQGDEAPVEVLYTRNALYVGREGFNRDRMDILLEDIGQWELYESIQDITNRKLKEQILLYELENLKTYVDVIAPQLKEQLKVSHFL